MAADTAPAEEAKAQPAGPSPDLPNLPTWFWESRPLFRQMRCLAAYHRVSPDALLGNYLARTAAMVAPGTEMFSRPDPSGLDLLVAILGNPGDSKTMAWKLGRRSMPTPDLMNYPKHLLGMIDGLSISSGLLGDPIQGGNDANARDLPRNRAEPARALIGDPRNDENALVSQLHGLLLRFHNRMVQDNAGLPFGKVQEKVRFHYQYILLNDFLPRIVHPCVLDQLKTDGNYDCGKIKFFHWKNFPFMPAEFSVAAYRLGHSMVRPGYRLDDNVLLPIFPVPSQGFPEGLTGFRALNPAWALDWGRFIDTDIRSIGGTEESDKKRLQFAYRLDTSLVNPLGDLPPAVAANPSSLPLRNLLRGWRLGLPSGQAVARAMGVTPLTDEEILIGKAVDEPGPSDLKPIVEISDVFRDNCPLWTYILAEAAHHKVSVKVPVQEDRSINTPKLGPVGGRIVAEVFLGLMFGDNTSVLTRDPNWTPPQGSDYTLKNLVLYALGA